MRLESYDIYSSDSLSKTAVVEQFYRLTVDNLDPQPLTVSFVGVAGLASVAHISVSSSGQQCVSRFTEKVSLTDEHLAHAVPGEYPPNGESSYVDRQVRGYVWVTGDGGTSPTNFASGSQVGKIQSFTWSIVET